MNTMSHIKTLTNRRTLLQKRTVRLISLLRRLVRYIEADIKFDEEQKGICDPVNSNYSTLARKLSVRRDNLIATISRLEASSKLALMIAPLPPPSHNPPRRKRRYADRRG